jgi:hypothetical protein
MTEYTPSTIGMRVAWQYWRSHGSEEHNPKYAAEFDRWLALVKEAEWHNAKMYGAKMERERLEREVIEDAANKVADRSTMLGVEEAKQRLKDNRKEDID